MFNFMVAVIEKGTSNQIRANSCLVLKLSVQRFEVTMFTFKWGGHFLEI